MTTPKRKRVLICFLGGATIDERERLGDTVTKPSQVKPWLRQMSEMDIIAETDGAFVASGITPVGLPEWAELTTVIRDHYDDVDGVVVVHQFSTLPVAATTLALMLPRLGKPVVLCGSQLVSSAERSAGHQRGKSSSSEFGAKANFINAVQVAVSDCAEVVVVSGSRLYRGATVAGPATQLSGEVIGKIDFGIRFLSQQQRRNDKALQVAPDFDTHVAVAEYFPGVDVQHTLSVTRSTRAIFLSSPDGSASVLPVIQNLRSTIAPTMPIVLYTPDHAVGATGPLIVHAPSRSAALLKTMWALGQTTEAKRLRKLLS
jgi:L-asparaginase/Glu-tRNA(Gln) amidotransferase subunit D